MTYSALVYTKTRRCPHYGRSDRFLRTVKGESWNELRNTVIEQMAKPESIAWTSSALSGFRKDTFPLEEP